LVKPEAGPMTMNGHFLQRVSPNHRRKGARSRAKTVQLSIESLEGRIMLHTGASHQLPPVIRAGQVFDTNNAVDVHPLENQRAVRADVVVGSQLVITQQPEFYKLVGFVFVGIPCSVSVAMDDTNGQVQTAFNGSLTIALAANPGGAKLGGNLTSTASNGVATFSGLTLDQPGVGYVLQVSGGGLQTTTAAFDVEANETLTIGTRPPGPTVLSIQSISRSGELEKIILTFSAPMDPATVANWRNFTLLDAGVDHSLDPKHLRQVRLTKVADNPATDSVTLMLGRAVSLKDSLRLILNAKRPSGLKDATGRALYNWGSFYPVYARTQYYAPLIE
jgi:hypothetical protein